MAVAESGVSPRNNKPARGLEGHFEDCSQRVLAVDPALRKTGFGILDRTGKKLRALTYGVVANPPNLSQSGCLVQIRETLAAVIEKHRPEACAIEGIIYVQSHKTAITMGAARGAAMIAAAEFGIPIYEYAPRKIKQAVVGRGAAQKGQVAFMVRALLGLSETPPPDAADALAIGIAHYYASDSADALALGRERI